MEMVPGSDGKMEGPPQAPEADIVNAAVLGVEGRSSVLCLLSEVEASILRRGAAARVPGNIFS